MNPAKARPAWPIWVDEQDMDKLQQYTERELSLLEQIHETQAQVRDVNAAILKRLEENDKDKEIRLRTLESVWQTAKGGVIVTMALGVVAKMVQLFWAWGVKP